MTTYIKNLWLAIIAMIGLWIIKIQSRKLVYRLIKLEKKVQAHMKDLEKQNTNHQA